MRAGMVQPDDLIDLKQILESTGSERAPDGGWRIGVAVPGIVLGAHEALVRDWPGVVEGMNLAGSTQVQGRATLAGNLQRLACGRFRAGDGRGGRGGHRRRRAAATCRWSRFRQDRAGPLWQRAR